MRARQDRELKGNLTDKLWEMMGVQLSEQGVERHGQSCFLYIHPVGTDGTRLVISMEAPPDRDVLDNDLGEPGGPIDLVLETVLEDYVRYDNADPDDDIFQYDGLRAGAGWIYAAILVAKSHGCTQADVVISSNDGNLYVACWDRKLGAFVQASHHVYYGT